MQQIKIEIPKFFFNLYQFFTIKKIHPTFFFQQFAGKLQTELTYDEIVNLVKFVDKNQNADEVYSFALFIQNGSGNITLATLNKIIQQVGIRVWQLKSENEQKQQEQQKNQQNIQKQQQKLKPQQSLTKQLKQKLEENQVNPSQIYELFDPEQKGHLTKVEFIGLMQQFFPEPEQEPRIEELYTKLRERNKKIDGVSKAQFYKISRQKNKLEISLSNQNQVDEKKIQQIKSNGKQQQMEIEEQVIIESQIMQEKDDNLRKSWQDFDDPNEKEFNTILKKTDSLTINYDKDIEYKPIKQQENSQKDKNFQQFLQQEEQETPDIQQSIASKILTSNDFQNVVLNEDESLPGYQQFLFLYQELEMSKQNFTDPTFPPGDITLGKKFNGVFWARATQMFNSFQVFQDTEKDKQNVQGVARYISPGDIQQGSLGDCYFLSCISSIAYLQPKLLFKLFLTQKYNPKGLYAVKLCVDGQWKAILLDDYFPSIACNNKNHPNHPAFTKSNGNEIWVLLLEKAWAKLAGSYHKIERGFCKFTQMFYKCMYPYYREVLRVLTGAPTITLSTTNEKFLDELKFMADNQCILTASATGDQEFNKDIQKQLGLVGSHAYSVLKLMNVVNSKHQEVQLVQLRNPWGKNEWKGDYSENSNLWTKEQHQEMVKNKVGQGVFYMDIDNFIQYFPRVEACILKKNYEYNSIVCSSFKNKPEYFSFEVKESGEYFITVNQCNERLLYGACDFNQVKQEQLAAQYKYSPALILIAQISNENQGGEVNMIYKGSKFKRDFELWYGGYLQKGNYIAYCQVFWEWTECYDFVLSFYGPKKTQVQQIERIPGFLDNVLINKARRTEKKKIVNHHGKKFEKVHEMKYDEGFGYMYVKNLSDQFNLFINIQLSSKIKSAYETNMDFTNSWGLLRRKEDKDQHEKHISLFVLPFQECITIFVFDVQGFQYSMQERFTLIPVK